MNYETTIEGRDMAYADTLPATRSGVKWLVIIIALAAAIAAGVAAWYFMGGKKDSATAAGAAADAKDSDAQAQTVTVVAPGLTTVVRIINATGTIAARRQVPVGVVGEGGRVVQVYADAGDWVRQGQLLVAVDRSVQSQQAAAQQAQIGVAKANLRLAENELARSLALVGRGFVSKADVDRKLATRDSARAQLNVAEAQYQQSLASNARLNVYAPTSGYVLDRSVEPGQTVSAGSPALFLLAKDGQFELQAQLGEADLVVVTEGTTGVVTPVGTDRQFEGRVWQVSPLINQETRQGTAHFTLPFDRMLRPGGFASVAIKAGSENAIILPESAVQSDKGKSFVYIIGSDNKTQRRDVVTGTVTNDGVPIVEGLSGTERVVLFAGGFLNPGEKVKPKLQQKASEDKVQAAVAANKAASKQ